ncbi:membrane protein insertion efficiency factor YidD [Clostridium sp. CS001]|uniref:membrane protein insertion efficiency factor YidD n=1 Tax=Clostridium sp. CS001 TaxID=2880648 RepID=UPI001CF10929|nr:membrane protein insertion efficiency factor YidD [Clostridium sp. CS001]MCB2290630.1 membrane protein insertion efficiency factor YidD [Clostridium sp. CS001]
MKKILILGIKSYRRYISPLKRPCCIFYPTCSQYTLEAIEKYGAVKGSIMGIKRIARCHPYNKGGFDPVK